MNFYFYEVLFSPTLKILKQWMNADYILPSQNEKHLLWHNTIIYTRYRHNTLFRIGDRYSS